jgi:glycosyltransferase involved in cell wall biosynthesis
MISVVIPAYNEADRIGETVAAIASLPRVNEVIVVDDGSTDDTAPRADAAGATVIRTAENRGKGAALVTGIEAAEGDVLALLDADLGATAAEAACLIEPVVAGEADMTIATFPVIPGRGGGFGFVVKLARWGIARATGREMAAPLSGQRVMRREVWRMVGGMDPGFGAETAFTIDALCAGFRVLEVPTTMTHRVTGRDAAAVRHRARQFLAVAAALWRRRSVRCR